jgi:accessory colonization factor AcfC
MNYTIKIAENDKESTRIISMIKEMAGNSSNIGIYEDETGLSSEMDIELERRYQIVLNKPNEGRSWDQVKAVLPNR